MYYPDAGRLEDWVGENGINGFREGIEQRRGCCAVRKVEPFRRALAGRGAWVTGIRRGQSASRALAAPVEWDGEYGLHKVSPLLSWSEGEIWDYIRKKRLPYNSLHDLGFPSIGCAPCTRAVQPGRMRAPDAGGGSVPTRENAACTPAERFLRSGVLSRSPHIGLTIEVLSSLLRSEGQKVLIVGGGEVALRKVTLLERTGALITLVAPEVAPELEAARSGRYADSQSANSFRAFWKMRVSRSSRPRVGLSTAGSRS